MLNIGDIVKYQFIFDIKIISFRYHSEIMLN